MQSIKTLFGDIEKNKDKKTERGEMMKFFIDRLNPSRLEKRMPPLSFGRMGKLLEKIPTKDLYYLKRICEDSKNFSARFWWELNPKNHTS